ncbi:UNVERIFIED_CONTAM: hypothetical protein RMT77_011732 [Armadillidium vulgare]
MAYKEFRISLLLPSFRRCCEGDNRNGRVRKRSFYSSDCIGIALLIFSLLVGCTCAISISYFEVPPYQVEGSQVELKCQYKLEKQEALYSVKWYWNQNEFFRYTPSASQKISVFDVKGVSVDTSLSDSTKVTLRSVSLESSGKYRCEVSADMPTFHTEAKYGEMLVVDLPDQEPQITGGQERFHIGDEVYFNCTSVKSRPAASLAWYINGRLAETEYLIEHAPQQDDEGLETSRLGLRFIAGPRHFPNGVLNLKCTASIVAVYWQSSESLIEGHPPQKGPALESKGIYSAGSSLPSSRSMLIIKCIFWLLKSIHL